MPSSSTNDLRDTYGITRRSSSLPETITQDFLLSIKAHYPIPTLIKSTGKVTELNYGVNFVSLHRDAFSPFILVFLSNGD